MLIIISTLATSAKSYSQHVNLLLKEVPIEDAFSQIRQQAGVSFLWNEHTLKDLPPVSVSLRQASLEEAIRACVKGLPLTFQIHGNVVYIQRKEKTLPPAAPPAESLVPPGHEITGVVTDSATRKPLVGVTVKLKDGSSGTVTDGEGHFSLEVPDNAVLIVSYLGYSAREVSVNGRASLNISLAHASTGLDQVIVTALGIKRKTRDLGYSQQTLDAKELSSAPATNWSSGLKGKVAGLKIISGSTGPINSEKIQLRGTSSLNLGQNGALIVIDGVPMDQDAIDYGNKVGAAYGTEAPVDYGNAISELNQADIQEVTVLKGPSAAALYGSRAANGVVIITTKSGAKNQKLGVSLNSTVTFNSIINWPDYQYEYGAGGIGYRNSNGDFYYSFGDSEDGPSTNTPEAFGPKFNGQKYFQYDPGTQAQGAERTLWRPYKNNRKDLYNTGVTTRNSLILQGGDQNGSARVALTYEKNKYILPNTGYKRYGVSFNGNYQISNRIKVTSTLNYNNRNSDNLPGFGISNGSMGYFLMFLMPSVDINWYKPIWQKGKEQLQQLNPFSNWSSNPYYLLYVNTNSLNSDQMIGSTQIDAKITDHLSLTGRISLNSLAQLREEDRGYSDQKHPKGYYGRQDIASNEINAQVLINYKNQVGDKFRYALMGGGNQMSYKLRNIMSSVDQLSIPGVYKLANGVHNPLVESRDSREKMNSLFGQLSLSWNDNIFVDVTGRNDWSSTLPLENDSYFYPSVTGSFILSDIFKIRGPVNLLKYRLSFAQVGSGASPYQTSLYYNQSKFPSSAQVPTSLYNSSLKPEITSSWETGFDLQLLNDRLGANVTFYSAITKNQILSLPSDIVTGFSQKTINAGNVRNDGVEIVVTGTPAVSNDLRWDVTLNWSTNRNRIQSLTTNLVKQTLTSIWLASFVATKGGSTNDLWGKRFKRDPQGSIIYENGAPQYDDTTSFYGNVSPDWVAGVTNTIRYKNFHLSFTFDGQYGGLLWSGTHQRASWAGTTKNTLPGRDEGTIIGKGVKLDNGKYVPNDVPINTESYYTQYNNGAIDGSVYNDTFLKFREISLSYTFSKKLIRKLKMQDLSVTLFGRDLAVFSNYPMFDPEGGTKNGAGNVFVRGAEIASMPLTASYGATLNIGF